jgi:hypothetical protein
MRSRAATLSCVTVDVHDVDMPEDVAVTAQWLASESVRATFFVPTALLLERRYHASLASLVDLGHEVASHGHLHDWDEVERLRRGERLGFLADSRARLEEFFRRAPVSFRSPHWCTLAPATIAELARLGYAVDSSATPQRLPFLSSRPFEPGWFFSPRRPHALAAGLLEVPTSTLLIPASAATFLTLRGATSVLMGALETEARLAHDRVLLVQLHVEDLSPDSLRVRGFGPLTWHDFLPRRRGGFGLKWALQERDQPRIVARQRQLVRRLAAMRCQTLEEIARERAAAGAPRGGA